MFQDNSFRATNARPLHNIQYSIRLYNVTLGTNIRTRPHDLVHWRQLEDLPQHCSLTITAQKWENLPEIEIDIRIHGGQIASVAGIWIGGV